jgi:hypothetical protein
MLLKSGKSVSSSAKHWRHQVYQPDFTMQVNIAFDNLSRRKTVLINFCIGIVQALYHHTSLNINVNTTIRGWEFPTVVIEAPASQA